MACTSSSTAGSATSKPGSTSPSTDFARGERVAVCQRLAGAERVGGRLAAERDHDAVLASARRRAALASRASRPRRRPRRRRSSRASPGTSPRVCAIPTSFPNADSPSPGRVTSITAPPSIVSMVVPRAKNATSPIQLKTSSCEVEPELLAQLPLDRRPAERAGGLLVERLQATGRASASRAPAHASPGSSPSSGVAPPPASAPSAAGQPTPSGTSTAASTASRSPSASERAGDRAELVERDQPLDLLELLRGRRVLARAPGRSAA